MYKEPYGGFFRRLEFRVGNNHTHESDSQISLFQLQYQPYTIQCHGRWHDTSGAL